jgi:phosphoglycerate dehydrogenase-like enzyme
MTPTSATNRPRIGIACNPDTRRLYLGVNDLRRLERLGEVAVEDYDVPSLGWDMTAEDPEIEHRFITFAAEVDVLILGHGAPRVTNRVIAGAPRLRMVGELEGDRRAGRVDLGAATKGGVLVVDTTNASSAPVAEWALALALIGLRQHGRFRDIIAGKKMSYADYKTNPPGRELAGKRVGMIGFGHIGWCLRELLAPFGVRIEAYDPYAPRELADALGIDFTPLDRVLGCDVVFCLVPETPATTGMIGIRELALLPRDSVFVNVARGVVVDLDALVTKAQQEDAWFCIDVHDPEPIAVDSPLVGLRNVFLSPHIAGNTVEGLPRFFGLMVDEVERYVSGVEPRAQLTDRVVAGRSGGQPSASAVVRSPAGGVPD